VGILKLRAELDGLPDRNVLAAARRGSSDSRQFYGARLSSPPMAYGDIVGPQVSPQPLYLAVFFNGWGWLVTPGFSLTMATCRVVGWLVRSRGHSALFPDSDCDSLGWQRRWAVGLLVIDASRFLASRIAFLKAITLGILKRLASCWSEA